MTLLYTQGGCYELFLLLREIFPDAEPWYDQVEGHVYTKIGNAYYDIKGKRYRLNETACPMTDEPNWMKRAHRWKKSLETHPTVKEIEECLFAS